MEDEAGVWSMRLERRRDRWSAAGACVRARAGRSTAVASSNLALALEPQTPDSRPYRTTAPAAPPPLARCSRASSRASPSLSSAGAPAARASARSAAFAAMRAPAASRSRRRLPPSSHTALRTSMASQSCSRVETRHKMALEFGSASPVALCPARLRVSSFSSAADGRARSVQTASRPAALAVACRVRGREPGTQSRGEGGADAQQQHTPA